MGPVDQNVRRSNSPGGGTVDSQGGGVRYPGLERCDRRLDAGLREQNGVELTDARLID